MIKMELRTNQKNEAIDITDKIAEIVREQKIQDGICFIYCPHTTAGIFINENADPSVVQDILEKLNELVPESRNYHHLEGNADAHIKSSIIGCSLLIPIENGRIILGRWQGIFFAEFDGPRRREIMVMARKFNV